MANPAALAVSLGSAAAAFAFTPTPTSLPFTLGTSRTAPEITFGEVTSPIEIPPRLDALGGYHFNAQHDFPGGYRTLQALGPFPGPLLWSGWLLGGNAFNRSYGIDQIRKNGTTAYLNYGPWSWQGLVVKYLASVRHQNLVKYEIEFIPTLDLTQTAPPTAANSETLLNKLLSGISSAISSATGLSPATLTSVTGFVTTVGGVLAVSGGSISGLSAAAIGSVSSAATAAQANLKVDAKSSNAATAAQASGLKGPVAAAAALLTQTPKQTVVRTVNPNLAVLAAQYLGDPSRWTDIATLNGFTDVTPKGIQEVAIPPS